MNIKEHFGITACWGPRLENFNAVKERVGNVLARLSRIDEPILARGTKNLEKRSQESSIWTVLGLPKR